MFSSIARWLHRKDLEEIQQRSKATNSKIKELTEKLQEKEALLIEQNARLNSILESQNDCIARVTIEKNLVYANTKYAETFCGTTDVNTCAEIDFIQHVHPEDRHIVMDAWEQLMEPPHRLVKEHRVIIADGTVRWFHWEVAAIKDAMGCVAEVQAIGRDITSRKKAEENIATQLIEIQKKNRILEVIIYATGGYLWFKDHDGKYVFCDRKFREEFFGLKPGVDNAGYDDVQLIDAFKKKYRSTHEYGQLCISTDVHSMQQKMQCKYIEGGYIGNNLFVIEVVKTPHFDCVGRYLGNIGVAWDRSGDINKLKDDIAKLKEQGRCLSLSHNELPHTPFVYWILPATDYEKKNWAQSICRDLPLMEQRQVKEEISNILEKENERLKSIAS